MILQGVFQLSTNDGTHVAFEQGNRILILPVSDWEAMVSPKSISVTVMKKLLYAGQKEE